jgi:uncharacterized protein (DUF2235 family)
MALYAFDGTWNSAKDNEDTDLTNTNVVRFYQAYTKHSGTDDFYLAGVGTRLKLIGRIFGGVFGLGELPRINEAYDHLCKRWAAGDHVIDIVGFSRGAATTLDFCHRIQEDGIRRPGSDDVVEPNPRIRFLGVWDVVAAFGLANLGAVDLNIGHHLSLPASMVEYCYHAMAIDERRPSFLQTRLNGANEVWFRGVHSDVGGGNKNRGLNDIALKWMMNKAKAAGLPIKDEDISALAPNPKALPHPDHKLPLNVRVISAVDRVHATITRLDDWTNPPDTCPVETPADEQKAMEVGAIEVLPPAMRRYVAVLWEAAVAAAAQLDFSIEGATDALLTLFQGRCVLITNENQLNDARNATVKLVAAMVQGAQARSFHNLTEFFLTEALFQLRPLYPFTD